jgi:hypothetical protein
MIQEFNDLPWHDAELKEIIIDRAQKDRISIWLQDAQRNRTEVEGLVRIP